MCCLRASQSGDKLDSCSATPPLPPGLALPLRADFVPEDKISNESQRQKEDGEDNEVQVEFGVQHVQLLEDCLRLLEVTRLTFTAVKIITTQAVDGQDDAFKPVPETHKHVQRVQQRPLLCGYSRRRAS